MPVDKRVKGAPARVGAIDSWEQRDDGGFEHRRDGVVLPTTHVRATASAG